MNIIYLEWKGLQDEAMCRAFEEAGHAVVRLPFAGETAAGEQLQLMLGEKQKEKSSDTVFSLDYFPEVSDCCMELGLRYVSWICDKVSSRGYSANVVNPCNAIFVFDYMMYEELCSGGIDTVYYLPLGLGMWKLSEGEKLREASDDLTAQKTILLHKLKESEGKKLSEIFAGMDDFTRGYLDGVIQAQKQVRQHGFLEEMLTTQILQKLEETCPIKSEGSLLSLGALYADWVFYPYITALEQQEIKRLLQDKYEVTECEETLTPAKININITPRNIKTGITQWAMEVMGRGGFLLSDYQQELFEYFEEGKDFVCYLDHEDLLAKVDYYSQHHEEREQIARNGCQKVLEAHTLQQRVNSMFITLQERTQCESSPQF